MELNVILPSKPKVLSEDDFRGSYEIEGLYPGYGQTLGNSLRRIILSSIVGSAVTSVKIEGVPHEFSTIDGLKEDALSIILNLKKVHFKLSGDGPVVATVKAKGVKTLTAKDIDVGGQVEVTNPDQVVATLTDKNASLEMELTLEKGIGYVPKEVLKLNRPAEIGTIILDASFTPVRRTSYEVENMRVGDRTDYNRLMIHIETDGSVSPHETLEKSINIMIEQLKAIVGFVEVEKEPELEASGLVTEVKGDKLKTDPEESAKDQDFLKTRIEDADLPSRVIGLLSQAGIRTVGGLARKKESDIEEIAGLGAKAVEEIKEYLEKNNLKLKS